MSDEKAPQDDTAEEATTSAEDEETEEREPRRPARSARPAGAGRGKTPGRRAEAKPAPAPLALLVVVGVGAACLGAAGGWFGHEAQAKAKLRADSAPAASGSAAPSGPCGAWQQKICAGSGDTSAACAQAKSAVDLLTPPTCELALQSVAATLAKVKAERASCDTLVTKLCGDLPPGSKTCTMVRERTPSFPRERCDGMLAHYDQVIAELRKVDQQGGPQLGGGVHGMPGGMPGMPPHAMGAPPGAPGVPPAAKP